MDPHPLGMDPGAEIHNGRKLVSIRFLSGGQHRVQFRDECMDLCLEMFQFKGHVRCVHSKLSADSNLDMFKTWFTSERAHETRVRHRQVFHGE